MRKVHTTCVYCGCGCGLFLHVEGERVVGASPSLAHPMSRGRLCIKGWLAGEFVGHPERLRYPLIREGERLRRATWDEALSLTVTRLRSIKEEFGGEGLGVLTSAKGTNEENYLLMKLARAGLGTNNVDNVARLCHAPTVVALREAFGSSAMTGSISDLAISDALLVVGSNASEQHPLVACYILEAKASGARLVVADPRRTQLSELADIHLRPRPGTDIAWINALLGVIIRDGLIDQEFIASRTEGFEQVRSALSGYTPEASESATGIPAEDLVAAAEIFGSAERGAVVYAMGITQHRTGTDNVQALANLVLATGNVGREGTGLYPLRGHQNVQGACDMGALPDLYCGYQRVTDSRGRFEQAWGVDLPGSPGLTAIEMIEAAVQGRLRGLIIVGENPVMSYPDSSRVRRALEALEFLLVWDIFPTQTAALADVVLPAASFAEKDGTFTSTERRVQLVRRAVPPPGEARAEWEVICELLRRLSVPGGYSSPGDVMDEVASLTPQYGGISYDRLGVGGLQWPCPALDHPGTGTLHREGFPIGRARFRAVEAEESDGSLRLVTGRCLYHFHTGTMTRRTHLLEREVPSPFVEIHPRDACGLGLQDGQAVCVETSQGRITLPARLTDSVPVGCIFLPIHFVEAQANILTAQALDPLSGIPELKASYARLRRAEG